MPKCDSVLNCVSIGSKCLIVKTIANGHRDRMMQVPGA